MDCLHDGKSSRWFELSSSNIGNDLVDWNDYTKSRIGDHLHHSDVCSFYFAMFDEFHQHKNVHRVNILCRKWHFQYNSPEGQTIWCSKFFQLTYLYIQEKLLACCMFYKYYFCQFFGLQVVMHGEESQVLGDLRQSEMLIEQDFTIWYGLLKIIFSLWLNVRQMRIFSCRCVFYLFSYYCIVCPSSSYGF